VDAPVVDQRYLLLDPIGSGATATVYCAQDLLLDRRVALKLLRRCFACDEESVKRFEREAASAAAVRHPNVVAVHGRGEWNGTRYITMEYVDGRSLTSIIRQDAPLKPARAIQLVAQLLRATGLIHRQDILHRDLKPDNAIVDRDDRLKLTDFGIARRGGSDLTQTGSMVGTARYVSPEQAQGRALTAASDLYAVGIILYELLTGRVPFDGDSVVTIALKHVNEPPAPPSASNPSVPPALERVVMQALAKDPAHRFADADAFIASLEQAAGCQRPSSLGARVVRSATAAGMSVARGWIATWSAPTSWWARTRFAIASSSPHATMASTSRSLPPRSKSLSAKPSSRRLST
jgi:serine/threonine-protein kinase